MLLLRISLQFEYMSFLTFVLIVIGAIGKAGEEGRETVMQAPKYY